MDTTESEFTITAPKKFTFRKGWGVYFVGIFNEDEQLSEVEGGVVEISEGKIEILPGPTPCVTIENGTYYPVENFKEHEDLWQDDTHDFRDRWFEYEGDARKHLADTLDRWEHPQVWECFVTFS